MEVANAPKLNVSTGHLYPRRKNIHFLASEDRLMICPINRRTVCIALIVAASSAASVFGGTPTLTKVEAIRLANEAAKKDGYKLNEYQSPEAHYEYVRKDDTWFISYEGKPGKSGNVGIGHHFCVLIRDKTRKVLVCPGQ